MKLSPTHKSSIQVLLTIKMVASLATTSACRTPFESKSEVRDLGVISAEGDVRLLYLGQQVVCLSRCKQDVYLAARAKMQDSASALADLRENCTVEGSVAIARFDEIAGAGSGFANSVKRTGKLYQLNGNNDLTYLKLRAEIQPAIGGACSIEGSGIVDVSSGGNTMPISPTATPTSLPSPPPAHLNDGTWRDPVTARTWIVGVPGPANFDMAATVCKSLGGNWGLPTRGDIQAALPRLKLSNLAGLNIEKGIAWTSDTTQASDGTFFIASYGVFLSSGYDGPYRPEKSTFGDYTMLGLCLKS